MDDGELTGAGPTTDGGPVTDRGRRTRDRLVVAAREVFAERGFADTRMSDVAERAGVSHGTVYVYFDSKAALMAAVVEDLLAEIGDYLRGGEADEAAGRIAEANLRYLRVYTEHARMLQVVEEAAIAEVALDRALSDFRAGHVARVEAGIRRLQGEGRAAADLDPGVAAAALSAMVEGYARHAPGYAVDLVHPTLTALWLRGLGLTQDAEPSESSHQTTNPSPVLEKAP